MGDEQTQCQIKYENYSKSFIGPPALLLWNTALCLALS